MRAHAIERRAPVERVVGEVAVLHHIEGVLSSDPAQCAIEPEHPDVARAPLGVDRAEHFGNTAGGVARAVAVFLRRGAGRRRQANRYGGDESEGANEAEAFVHVLRPWG